MKYRLISLLCLLVTCCLGIHAQQNKLKFSVVEFAEDQFDLSARDKQYEKIDGSGSRYAIIKVTSDNPNDDLREYKFNFGQLRHETVMHDDVLWLYVQKNAKQVTISREGYATIDKYDLRTTIEAGKNYVMVLTSAGAVTYSQMVQFEVSPNISGATVIVKGTAADAPETLLGMTDATGKLARSLNLGTYRYKVMALNYQTSEGLFTLNSPDSLHSERVTLKTNFAEVTLSVDMDAEIFINKERQGTKLWRGALQAGNYEVECRKDKHHSTTQFITVRDGEPQEFKLKSPTPITGSVSVSSQPQGARIKIDGVDRGVTPRNISGLLIGQHQLVLSKDMYKTDTLAVEIRENEITPVEQKLATIGEIHFKSRPSGAELYINGENVGITPLTREMQSGDYQIRLTHPRRRDFDKTIHLDNSKPSVKYRMCRKNKISSTRGYLSFGYQFGGQDGFLAAAGGYISNFNFEGYYGIGLKKAVVKSMRTIIYNNTIELATHILKAKYFGGKLGYGFNIKNKYCITPQIGYGNTRIITEAFDFCPSFISFGSKMEFALVPHLSLALSLQDRVSIRYVDKDVSTNVSKIKRWERGFDAFLGLNIHF